jgi:bacteriorhodopsin
LLYDIGQDASTQQRWMKMPVVFLLPLGALLSLVAARLTKSRARYVYVAIGCVMAAVWLLYMVLLVNLELPD